MIKKVSKYYQHVSIIKPFWKKIGLIFFIDNLILVGLLIPPLILRAVFDYAYPYQDTTLFVYLLVIPFLLICVLTLLSSMRNILELYVSQNIFKDLHKQFYSKVHRLPMSFFNTYKTGDIIYRMSDDLTVVEETLIKTIPQLLVSMIKLTLILVVCFSINLPLTLFALMGVPIYFFQTHYFSKHLKLVNQENQAIGSELFNLLDERLSNIKLMKIYHKWSHELSHLLGKIGDLFVIERKAKMTKISFHLVSTFFNRFWTLLLALYAGYSVISGFITIGEVVAITTCIALLKGPFVKIASLYSRFITSQVSFDRMMEILDHEEEHSEIETGRVHLLNGNITFNNVTFSYEDKRDVLKNLSFHIPKNTSAAIVGSSGIGKSSIVDLILRFYPLKNGEITLDDIRSENIDLASLRRQIGLVSPHEELFSGTVKENIVYAAQGYVTDEAAYKAAKMANIHDFIMSLPDQYNTDVGPKGSRFSSGQRQRLCIARALIHDPKILIFDEATSALDGASEKQIHRLIKSMNGKKTIIVIAHKLSTIQQVDQVIVLGPKGCIAEKGTVGELMEKRGVFYSLYELQIGGYSLFLQQLNFLLHSVRHHNRPVSLAVFDICNYSQLQERLDDKNISKFIDEFGLALRFLMREADHSTHDKSGRWWILMPETSQAEAENITLKLAEYLKESTFNVLEDHRIDLNWASIQCQKHHSQQDLMETLMKELMTHVQMDREMVCA